MKSIPIIKMTTADISNNLKSVLNKIETASQKRVPELSVTKPRLVAVSKTKPNESIIQAYGAGQRHFGENYVQELIEKAHDASILAHCKDIQWHLIGHLQSNKINKILGIPNLYIVETVDNQKLAAGLHKSWPKFAKEPTSTLNVFVQVNTSGESEKSGIAASETTSLCKFILDECKHLKLQGLMTIGQFGYNPENGPNPDFLCLRKCREEVATNLNLDWKDLELSMGMSDDFEQAVELGSTNVRVGSSIFGNR